MRLAMLACGHTHIPWQQEQGGRLALNPGAVSGSLDGDVRAQCAILTWDGAADHYPYPQEAAWTH